MESDKHKGSLFNQKYFEGYRRAVTMNEHGRLRVEFVYEGMYYTMKACPKARAWRRLINLLLPVSGLALLIYMMTVRSAFNVRGGVVLLQALTLMMLMLNAVCGVVRIMAAESMTRWEYRMSYVSAREISLVGGLLALALAALCMATPVNGVMGLTGYIGLTAAQALQFVLVSKERYTAEESKDMLRGMDVTSELTPR